MKKIASLLLFIALSVSAFSQSYFIEQDITNHPVFEDVTRKVRITSFEANASASTLKLGYQIVYMRDSVDVSSLFNRQLPQWVITNSYKVFVRDSEGNKIPNPDYDAEDPESEEFLMQWGFDYFREISFDSPDPVRLKQLMSTYILIDDLENHRFNF